MRETTGNLFLIVMLFSLAGRWTQWNGWAPSLIYIVWTLGVAIFILPVNPGMLAERSRPKEFKTLDKILLGPLGLFMVALYSCAALDYRMGWSGDQLLGVQIGGGMIAALGFRNHPNEPGCAINA